MSNNVLIIVPVIVGLVQVAKSVGMSSRFASLLAIVLGLGGMFLVSGLSPLDGIIAGLAASGLYSGVKSASGN